MSSPRVGVVRESMLYNPLLIKASLGQSRSRGLSVPCPDFTFGISSRSLDDGGMAEVLSSWRVQSRHENPAPHRPVVPDFVSLNRDAVKAGLVTSKELSQYRAQAGGVRMRSHAPRQQAARTPQHLSLPHITFGTTTRASSPLSDLLSHQYAHRWMEEQLSRSQTRNHKQLHRMKPGSDTRTSLLRRNRTWTNTEPLSRHTHTQTQYTKVPPAVDTFRNQDTRLWRIRTHEDSSDSASRRGHQVVDTD